MKRVCVSLMLTCAAAFGQVSIEALVDSTVEHARKEFNVPGISVAVVKNGKIVLAKGYGVRRLGSPEPMTARTMVGIGSNTKAFASAALAMLVDEKKLSWDDRVIDRLPEFALSDAYVTREMRIRDLTCHRSGLALGAGDLMFWPGTDLSASDILYRLRFVPLAGGFRAGYAYDNVLYNVIGAVVEKVSGKPWQRFISERFFEPLGMKSSRTSVRDIKPGDDAASPHAMNDGVLKALEYMPIDNVAPAGSLVSSAADMARWVMTLLNKGVTPDGKRLLSEQQANVLSTPLVLISGRTSPAQELRESNSNFTAYAMGEFISEYRSEYQVGHGGGILGMYTAFTMLPDHKLGVIVLSNQQESGALLATEYTVLDHYLKAPAKDWVEAYVMTRNNRVAQAKKTMSEGAAKRSAAPKPSVPLSGYAGRYRDPWYGDVLVSESGGQLTMRFTHTPLLTGRLEHWQHDTFVVRWMDRTLDADAYVTFWFGPDAKIEAVRMKPISPLTDFGFDFHDLRLTPVAAGTTRSSY